ncbi:MAG: hypothetical protein K0U86_21340 [Planctomycetes bacterium]|nr:hypothetical protein [Planctomycetota bacterium]MCH9727450.1 hypothetical protein [Planctomycetota bacterium]MCH9775955.1 hypothetical protein [Planctomycetota bacterium]MCH9791072.1 hypothetical protein [Planctomycetota bacterium]MDF1745730.1 hypothetical protein [Gimesia sp.]
MTDAPKKMIIGSMAVSGIVVVLALVDMIIGIPFRGSTMMDIMFLISASLVLFLCWDAWQDLR